ncbi:MAG: YfiR family protein [Verrucomicrobia bacterium]|nr:YfiR family protein [Cytophagales bacterium]
MKKTFISIIIFFFAGFCTMAQTNDYGYHGMFLYNFIKYTEWPAGSSVVNIAVIDNVSATTAVAKVTTAKGMQVKNIKMADNLASYQVIFVPSGSSSSLAKILEKTKGKAILVVTEQENLVRKGACFSFKVVGDKMKFQINQEAIKSAGLKVASTLSSMAVN